MTDEQARELVAELQRVFYDVFKGRRCTLEYVIANLTKIQVRWLEQQGIRPDRVSNEERTAAVLEALMQEHAVVS